MILNHAIKRFNRTPEQVEYNANNLDTLSFKNHPFKLLTGFYVFVTALSLLFLIGWPLAHGSTAFYYPGFVDVAIIAACIPLIWRGSLNAIVVAAIVYVAGKIYGAFAGPGMPVGQLIMALVCIAMTVDAFKTARFIKNRSATIVVPDDTTPGIL